MITIYTELTENSELDEIIISSLQARLLEIMRLVGGAVTGKDLDEYWEVYYEDMDCLFLDTMTEQEIKDSGLDDVLGIF